MLLYLYSYDKICCTQPRRISCISLCRRVSQETLNQYGNSIGYHIRFDGYITPNTKILFVTEGLLLRQLLGDPLYIIIIINF